LTTGAILSTLSNSDFLQKTLFFKAFRFFPLHFFLFQREGAMVCIVGKNFAYLWIITLGEAELEQEILFS